MIYFFIFVISFITVYLLTPDIRYVALKVSAIDKRNHRKIHKKVIAQLGGLAIYFGMWAGVSIIAIFDGPFFMANISRILGFGVCSTLILLLGIYDDFNGSGAAIKLSVQIIVALLFIKIGFQLERITVPGFIDVKLGILSVPLTVLWLVGITNAINLIDGLDGLATGVVAITAFFFCVYGIFFHENFIIFVSLSLLGASLAFLKYNFHPAKIFLGDTGSLFLGFFVSSLAIWKSNPGNPNHPFFLPAVIILLMPITDTVLAVIRRIARRQYIFRGDDSHIHHYYIKRGFDQIHVVAGFYVVTFSLGIASLLILHGYQFFK